MRDPYGVGQSIVAMVILCVVFWTAILVFFHQAGCEPALPQVRTFEPVATPGECYDAVGDWCRECRAVCKSKLIYESICSDAECLSALREAELAAVDGAQCAWPHECETHLEVPWSACE